VFEYVDCIVLVNSRLLEEHYCLSNDIDINMYVFYLRLQVRSSDDFTLLQNRSALF